MSELELMTPDAATAVLASLTKTQAQLVALIRFQGEITVAQWNRKTTYEIPHYNGPISAGTVRTLIALGVLVVDSDGFRTCSTTPYQLIDIVLARQPR